MGDTIYDLAFKTMEQHPGYPGDEALRDTIYFVFITAMKTQDLMGLVGADAYFDFKNFEEQFYAKNLDLFLDEAHLVDERIAPKNASKIKKLEYVYDNIYSSHNGFQNASGVLYLMLAEKIRKEHFPISGLESTVIAHGASPDPLENIN